MRLNIDEYIDLQERVRRRRGRIIEGRVLEEGGIQRMPFDALIPGFRPVKGQVLMPVPPLAGEEG